MLRTVTFSIVLMVVGCVYGYAQDGIDHGPTGTLNLDYFNPRGNAHIKWLINDMNRAHLQPAIRNIGAGRLKNAKDDLNYILIRFINHPQALALAALVAIASKDSTWAMQHYERALNLYPQYALTHAQYGKYMADIDMVDRGLEKLKKAAEMDPNLAATHVWLAAAYAKSGNAELAQEAAEKARSLGYKGNLPQ